MRKGMMMALVACGVAAVGLGLATAGEDGLLARNRARGRAVREKVAALRELAAELNLTDQQKGEIREIFKAHAPEIKDAVAALLRDRRALIETVRAEAVDEKAIRRASLALADSIADASILRASVRAEVRAVLTSEQLEKVDAALEDIEDSIDQVIEGLTG